MPSIAVLVRLKALPTNVVASNRPNDPVEVDEAVILEETDFKKIAQKASEITSFYKSPNS